MHIEIEVGGGSDTWSTRREQTLWGSKENLEKTTSNNIFREGAYFSFH